MSGAAGIDRLLNEIAEQPAVTARLLDRQLGLARAVAAELRRREAATIVFVARGSSDNAAVYGRYLFEICNRRLTSLAAPSSLTLYASGPHLHDSVIIGVSQSGQGEDVVAYLRAGRAQGALTIAIVNEQGSPLAEAAEWLLPCEAGPELSIPATKTVTAQMTWLAMLSAGLSDDGFSALEGLPAGVQRALDARTAAASMASQLGSREIDSVIGRGFAFPPALEIALKLKETSYTPAEPYSAADFLHGPVALVESDYTALVLDVGGRSSVAAHDIREGVRARGGTALLLSTGSAGADLGVDVDLDEPYAPIVALVLGQLLAVEVALARGLDPAQPRGLRKVTSTR